MILIVDYGMGNLGSIKNMLKKIGAPSLISGDPADVETAQKIILPGVGAFDNGMKNLKDRGFIEPLSRRVMDDKVPVLGICLGMQLFSRSSEEGSLPGLGWIDAGTRRFDFSHIGEDAGASKLKIPHMGWNTVEIIGDPPLFAHMPGEIRFYFVHSYQVVCKNEADVIGRTVHGIPFVSAIARGNIMGAQFHPEKSHKFGMKFLSNFVEL